MDNADVASRERELKKWYLTGQLKVRRSILSQIDSLDTITRGKFFNEFPSVREFFLELDKVELYDIPTVTGKRCISFKPSDRLAEFLTTSRTIEW